MFLSAKVIRAWVPALSVILVSATWAACNGDVTKPSDPTGPTPSSPVVVDVRFKNVGHATTDRPTSTNSVGDFILVTNNQVGTPLEITPCGAADSAGISGCSWPFVTFRVPVSDPDVNTVYFGESSLSNLETDLATLQNGTFPYHVFDNNLASVLTSLVVDERAGAYATSGIQRADRGDFPMTWGTAPLASLQAAASREGTQGRVITAVGFHGTNVVYVSYAWTHDTTPSYESKVLSASFDAVAGVATSLASEGYIITALGGDAARGYVLVGTRPLGQAIPRPLRIETDSAISQAVEHPVSRLAAQGYAVVGGMFDHHSSDSHLFNLYIGEK